ncbi:MORC family CW-type zinc finger protein 1 [Neomonachus schauinslandi]|uniref:MORC family CW-type zinc finger protein 1 n=1 Tax=Neomonachus schauinslandi TaxID=29088 RepID=A0A2Y9HG74_NEOSC|nr:MORC family CW-type zinc finger protein 1 [Neomonachus schauinslandi]
MGDKYAGLRRAQLHLDFIHANSTTHSFIFGALAELLDNARDAGAARLDVFSVDNEKLQGGFMLCFLDDGCGMSPEEASDIIYFGTSRKRSSTLKFIGQYGNGLKSGSMRIGKDFILFTKKEETMTCVFFSQTFCEREGLTEVVVPIPSWLTRTRKSVTDDPQKFSTELSIIFKYSPFRNEAELMQQFDVIYGKCGTLLVVYNLKLLLSGEPELDVKTDKEDILMAGALEDFPERWSFRAYTSVLYFEPWMRIFIQAKRVKTKHLCYCLYRPRKYLYVTSSFKGAFKNEVKKAEEAVKIAELVLKEAQVTVNRPDRTSLSSAKDVLQKALEDVEAKHKILKEKQRELKKARTLCLFFGVNIENRSQAGMFIYSNNRLIRMHEKVGPQLKLKSLLGAGVVGIVNIPLEIMEPSHNKQEFLNVQEYNHLLRVMGQYLVQYCKDTGISNRNLTLFWNEFGYQNDKDMEKSLDSVQYQRRQAMAIPFIIQCDLCLKWRILPSSITYQEKEFFDLWICANNPNPLENSCHQAERLPSIPLGTMSSVSPSKTEKEKQLREAIQRYHSRLADSQPQPQFIPTSRITEFTTTCQTSASKENTKTQKVRPWGDNLKQESLASFELSVSHRGWKRNPEGTDSDVECIAEDKIMKSPQKKAKPRQRRRLAALPENVSLAQRSQVFFFSYPQNASSWEINKKQSQNLVQECQALIEVETSNSDYPDIILVLDKSDTEVSLKQEKKEVSLMKKEKQEPCSDTPEIKRNSSLPNRESALMEDLSPSPGHNTSFTVSGCCHIAALLKESSQSTSVKETVRKLASNLREILQYFFPQYQLPSEFGYTSVEELAASFELEQCPEQTNKKLRMCFNQIQNVYMAQYERELKRKMQSIIYDANRRGVVNEISLGQCEEKRKITEDKLNNLRVKLAALLQKLQLGSPAGDQEQIDRYLEALLKEDNPLFRNALNKVTTDVGHGLPLEKNGK